MARTLGGRGEYLGHAIGFSTPRQRHGIAVTKREGQALVGDGRVGDTRVFLIKPQTFMNLSGQPIAAFLRQKPLALADILVVTDDIALPVGKLRLRAEGSAGGHNGLKSIIQELGPQEVPRLRIRVGRQAGELKNHQAHRPLSL